MHHEFDPERFIPATAETEKGYAWYIGTQLTKPGVFILAAERDGVVVGYAYAGLEDTDYMWLRGPAGVVYDVVVDPGHRGQGVGSALMEAALAELKTRGAPRVLLFTAEHNEGAQRLFARLGFRRTMIEMTRESREAE